ncbi:hypothetical protein EBR43_13840 [bacterium]|jgi:uncharacterized protein (DUF2237 family)|nr:hypothetical protein [bacterium]
MPILWIIFVVCMIVFYPKVLVYGCTAPLAGLFFGIGFWILGAAFNWPWASFSRSSLGWHIICAMVISFIHASRRASED